MINMVGVRASTPFNPAPPPPATGGEYWDFNIDDIFGWEMSYSEDGNLYGERRRYFKVMEITLDYSSEFWGMYYMVKLSEMYFNITTNSLLATNNPLIHASLINYTFGTMFPMAMPFGEPILNLFVPKNSSDDLTLHWCGNALMNSIPNFIDPTLEIIGSNRIYISDQWSNYLDLIYDSQGILLTGEMGIMDWMDGRERVMNWSRINDYNPLQYL